MSNRRQRAARAEAAAHNARQRELRARARIAPQPGLQQATDDAITLAVDAGLEPAAAAIAVGAVLAVLPQLASGSGSDPTETSSPRVVDPLEDPYALDSVLVPVGSALLLNGWEICRVDARLREEQTIEQLVSLQLHARVNGAPTLVNHTYLFDLDGMAKLGAEFYAFASRAGQLDEFLSAQHNALNDLPI